MLMLVLTLMGLNEKCMHDPSIKVPLSSFGLVCMLLPRCDEVSLYFLTVG